MANVKVGRVSHYYDKIGVAVLDLDKKISEGDKIKFAKKGEDLFEQEVASMEYEHKKLKSAGRGKSIGLKVDQPVKKGVDVYKV